MRILLLNAIGDPRAVRGTTLNHTFALPRYAPEHEYVFHSYGEELDAALVASSFDVIVIDTTFLCYRWVRPRELFAELRERYAFIGRSTAFKVALPQDEYDHSDILDEWLANWRVDLIYSPCFDHRGLLYKRCAAVDIRPALTGYVDDADVEYGKRLGRPLPDRRIDLSYRVRQLAPWCGRIAAVKSAIGDEFAERAKGAGLRIDVSSRDEATLFGEDWLAFLCDSKFVLGSESGSSLIDPIGEIHVATELFLRQHPNATFDEIEAACFPGLDGKHRLTAISPRIFETIVCGACPVLVRGEYGGIIVADRHYIPLEPDFSNIDEVVQRMRDERAASAMAHRAHQEIVVSGRYSYRKFVAEVLQACSLYVARGQAHAMQPAPGGIGTNSTALPVRAAATSLAASFTQRTEPNPLQLADNIVLLRDASFRVWLQNRYLQRKLDKTTEVLQSEIARLSNATEEQAHRIEVLGGEIARLTGALQEQLRTSNLRKR